MIEELHSEIGTWNGLITDQGSSIYIWIQDGEMDDGCYHYNIYCFCRYKEERCWQMAAFRENRLKSSYADMREAFIHAGREVC
jgi:hypothetical protein